MCVSERSRRPRPKVNLCTKTARRRKSCLVIQSMATLTCFVILVALVLSCVSLSVDRAAYRVRKAHSLATNQKCKPPKSISRNGVFSIIDGWLRLGKMISVLNDGRDILDDFLRPAFGDAHTIQETSFDGSSVITTIEPENMRAILATQFKVCTPIR